jgi:hypothetical protein
MAKGFEQKEGLDFQETFVPIIKWSTIIFMVVLITHFRWRISQMDVKTTFLSGNLQKEVYLMQAKGFVQTRRNIWFVSLTKHFMGFDKLLDLGMKKLIDFSKICT